MEINPEKFSSGFTILELLIVISIISIISAFSFPHLLNWQTSLLGRLTAQRIASDLRLAKIEALRTGATTKITFDPAQDLFIYRGCNSQPKIVNFPKGVDLYTTNFSQHTISFYPTGTPSMGGTITIRVNGKLMYLTITPVTGRVRIVEK
ncbi:MAG: GspH/FimT family protein [Atribacterota bacterium]|jgi:general secretion pathway protein H|nr:GspH/FimT family protein [Atribacterota bacterium]MDI9607718.1 GspH/FimT family protein [Atribacterota bacterium]HOA99835.1 GspH/FimT family protein [Candidatus Atribacteria bacterium]HPZ40160.1 GspH/FimT family protein [Candidatus Atribacteria bacterium]HQD33826.1 GspH/FimT family protein [Candidatus Atribacteria bacterium]